MFSKITSIFNYPPGKNNQQDDKTPGEKLAEEQARALELKKKNKEIEISKEEPEKKDGLRETVKKGIKESILKMTGIKSFFSWKEYKILKKEHGEDLKSGENVADLIESIHNGDKLQKEKLKNQIRELKQNDPKKYQEAVKLLWKNRNKKEALKLQISKQIEDKNKKELNEKKIEVAKETINSVLVAAGVLTGGATAYGTVIAKALNNLTFDLTKKTIDDTGDIHFDAKNIWKSSLENWKKQGTVGKISEVARYAGLAWMSARGIDMMADGNIEEYRTLMSKVINFNKDAVQGNVNWAEKFAILEKYIPGPASAEAADGVISETEHQLPERFRIPDYQLKKIPEIIENPEGVPEIIENQDRTLKITQNDGGYGKIITNPPHTENKFAKIELDSYKVQSGDNLWSILRDKMLKGNLETYLKAHGIDGVNFGDDSKLTDAQIENIVGNMMAKIEADPESFGISSGQISQLKAGDEINFQKLFNNVLKDKITGYDGKEHDNLIERATKLTKEDIENINEYEVPKEPTQCVVADTRLRKLSKDGGFWSEVMIKDVRAGDKVATMNQITGMLTWSMVVDKMVTGKKKIYQIETKTGRTIRTTSQHPYFVRKKYPQPEEISKQKLYRFEIDQSIKIENTSKDSVLAIGNKEQSYSLTISKKIKKKLLEKFRNESKNKGQLKYFNATVFAFGIIELMQKSKIKVHELVIDQEYPGYEKYIETICKFYYPDIQILFGLIGKKSPAHYTAYFTYRGKRKSDFQIDEEKIFKQIKNVLRTSSLQLSKGGQSYYNPTQTFSANILTNENEKVKSNFAVQDGLWIKVENLKAKEMIAVIYGDQIVWEKINKISVQQEEFVYDIEIQNTRNFIANNIVAHNTYIPEQQPSGEVVAEAHAKAAEGSVGNHVVSGTDGKVSVGVADIENTSVEPETPEQPIGPAVTGEMPQEASSTSQISEMDRLSIINSGEVRPDTFQFLKVGETMVDKNLDITVKKISPNIFFFSKGDISVGLIQNKDSFGNFTYQITPRINTGVTDNLLNNQQKLPEIEDFISKPENNFNSYNGGVDKAFNRAKELLRKTTTTTFNDDYSA